MTQEDFEKLLPGDTVKVTMWNKKIFTCKVIDVRIAEGKAFVFGPNVMYEHATPDMLEFVERDPRLQRLLNSTDYEHIIDDLRTQLAEHSKQAGDYNEANERLSGAIFKIYKACNSVLDLIAKENSGTII